MLTLIRNGGLPMVFILLFGLSALGAAFYFAVRAERRTLGFVEAMGRATLFATLAATAADVGATLNAVARAWDAAPPGAGPATGARLLVEGFAESTSPGILGFSMLALVAMLTAVGRRRLDERTTS